MKATVGEGKGIKFSSLWAITVILTEIYFHYLFRNRIWLLDMDTYLTLYIFLHKCNVR